MSQLILKQVRRFQEGAAALWYWGRSAYGEEQCYSIPAIEEGIEYSSNGDSEGPLCKLCGMAKQDPRLLGCHHSFCRQCIDEKLLQPHSTYAECPVCFTSTEVPHSEAARLRADSHASQVSIYGVDSTQSLEVQSSLLSQQSLEDISIFDDKVPAKSQAGSLDESTDFFLLEDVKIDRRPDFYLPFQYSIDLVSNKAKAWIRSLYFLPADLTDTFKINDVYALFVPIFLFRIGTKATCDADAVVNGHYQVIDGVFYNSYDEILAVASSALNHKLLWPLLADDTGRISLPRDQFILYSEGDIKAKQKVLQIDWDSNDAWKTKEAELKNRIEPATCLERLKKQYHTNAIKNLRVAVEIKSRTEEVVLLPIFATSFTYGDKTFEILLNASNEKVVGDSPSGWGTLGRWSKTVGSLLSTNL